MRKPFTLIIVLLLAAASLYLVGVFTHSSVTSVFNIDDLIRRGPASGPGQELNTRGIGELNSGNYEGAVVALREAVRLEPGNSVFRRNLSIAIARKANAMSGEEQAVIRLLEESLQLWPKNPEGLDGLSTIHFKAARYTAALDPAMILKEMMPERDDLAQYVLHLQKKVTDEKGMFSEKGDRFRLLYSDEKRLEYGGELISILQTQLDSLSVALGIFPERPIDVLLLTDDLGARATPQDPFLEGLYDGQIRLYAGQGIEDRSKLILTVRHEMVHALLHQASGNLPGWVHEGIAQIVGEEPDEERMNNLKSYLVHNIREGYKIDLAPMGISFLNLDPESRTQAYASSLLFMDYLSREYGSSFLPRFVGEISSGISPTNALENLTGYSFAQLQSSFSSNLAGEY